MLSYCVETELCDDGEEWRTKYEQTDKHRNLQILLQIYCINICSHMNL